MSIDENKEEEDLLVHEGDLIFKTLVKAVYKVDKEIDVSVDIDIILTTPRDLGFVGYANGKFIRGGEGR